MTVQSQAPALSATEFTRLVELACMAPSVRNSQPWRWTAREHTIELYADTDRRIEEGDSDGRFVAVSCGAALDHLVVAARGLGYEPHVTRLPDEHQPDLLARIVIEPGRLTSCARVDLSLVLERRTDRRRLTAWPVSALQVQRLCEIARDRGAMAIPIVDATDRFRIDLLLGRAADQLGRRPRDFAPAVRDPLYVAPDRELAPSDGLMVLGGPVGEDDVAAWLRAGEALSALWLEATRLGLAVVPLTAVCEVPELRTEFEQRVLGAMMTPHALVRVGWQPLGRMPRTPRRPVADVLTFV